MTESQAAVPVERPDDDRRARAEATLAELLRGMDVAATLDVRDLPDGSISIAVQGAGELQPGAPGRRGPVSDALQYLVNKLVNRPGLERRWIAVGLGTHPEPRGARKPAPAPGAPVAAAVPAGVPAAVVVTAAPTASTALAGPASPPARSTRGAADDERSLRPAADPAFEAAARALAERSARTGRLYGVVALSSEDRARLVQAVAGVPGVTARAEGEGRLRRVVLTPDTVVPMPRQRLPVDDDEE